MEGVKKLYRIGFNYGPTSSWFKTPGKAYEFAKSMKNEEIGLHNPKDIPVIILTVSEQDYKKNFVRNEIGRHAIDRDAYINSSPKTELRRVSQFPGLLRKITTQKSEFP